MIIVGLFGSHQNCVIVLCRILQVSVLTQSPTKKKNLLIFLILKDKRSGRGGQHFQEILLLQI